MIAYLLGVGTALLALTLLVSIRKCPPNHAMVISGMNAGDGKRSYKIVMGGKALVLPMIQQGNLLDLSVHKTTAALSTVYSKDNVPICASAVLQFNIIPTPAGVASADPALLGKTVDDQAAVVEKIVERPFIAILQRCTTSELRENHSDIANEILKDCQKDLENIGVQLVSCTIKSIDEVYDRRHDHGAV